MGGKKECQFREGELILRLRKNPEPVDGDWKEIYVDEY